MAIDILLKNKVNEIKQIGEDIGCIPTDDINYDWQYQVIQFCLEVQ
jgi:hypothetical protein